MLGVAIADSSMQTFGLCEFADDDEYSTLEACAESAVSAAYVSDRAAVGARSSECQGVPVFCRYR